MLSTTADEGCTNSTSCGFGGGSVECSTVGTDTSSSVGLMSARGNGNRDIGLSGILMMAGTSWLGEGSKSLCGERIWIVAIVASKGRTRGKSVTMSLFIEAGDVRGENVVKSG